jgi:hypothetical protein
MVNSRRKGARGQFVKNKNRLVVCGDLLYCYHEDGTLLFFTDRANEDIVRRHNWGKLANGYSATKGRDRYVGAHRILTNAPEGTVVDHINRNKKDNRLKNLRITDKSVNAFNSKLSTTNTSGHTGVWFRKDTQRWAAEIKKDGKKYSLGCFPTYEEAVQAREKGERLYYGT